MDLKPPYDLLCKKSEGEFWPKAFEVATECYDDQGTRLKVNPWAKEITFTRVNNGFIKFRRVLPDGGGCALSLYFDPSDWPLIKDDWFLLQSNLEINCPHVIRSPYAKFPGNVNTRALTVDELRVLKCISDNFEKDNKFYARKLGLSVPGLRNHLKSLYVKFKVDAPNSKKMAVLVIQAKDEGYV